MESSHHLRKGFVEVGFTYTQGHDNLFSFYYSNICCFTKQGSDCAVPIRPVLLTNKMPPASSENAASQSAVDIDMSRGRSLVSKLKLDPKKDADFVPLPMQLLRKYIAYARTFVFPR